MTFNSDCHGGGVCQGSPICKPMKNLILTIASTVSLLMAAPAGASEMPVCAPDNTAAYSCDYSKTKRPDKKERLFHSKEVERQIQRVKGQLTNPKLAWMFENCFPNTIDTTVH